MAMPYHGRFRSLLATLREKCPTRKQVIVRRVKMRSCQGRTTLTGPSKIIITIDRSLTSDMQLETLVHEWAHALEFDRYHDHGRPWAAAYVRAYAAYENFCDEIAR